MLVDTWITTRILLRRSLLERYLTLLSKGLKLASEPQVSKLAYGVLDHVQYNSVGLIVKGFLHVALRNPWTDEIQSMEHDHYGNSDVPRGARQLCKHQNNTVEEAWNSSLM